MTQVIGKQHCCGQLRLPTSTVEGTHAAGHVQKVECGLAMTLCLPVVAVCQKGVLRLMVGPLLATVNLSTDWVKPGGNDVPPIGSTVPKGGEGANVGLH